MYINMRDETMNFVFLSDGINWMGYEKHVKEGDVTLLNSIMRLDL